MKNKKFFVVITILLLGIMLTSCSSNATATNSWGGVSATGSDVYVTNATSILSIKADSGNVTWTYPEKAAATRLFYAAPVVAGDQVIVGDYKGLLVSLGIRDGKELWTFDGAKGHYVYSPLITADKIIAQNADGQIYALDYSGNLQWTFTAGHPFWATPVTDGTIVYAPCLDHYLYAINLKDGKMVWKTDLTGSLVASPLLSSDNSTLYIGTLDKTVVAIKTADGSIGWTYKADGGVWSTPVISEDQLFVGDESGKVLILKAADGSLVKAVDVKSPIIGTGVIMNDSVIFGDEAGEVVSVKKDGSHVIISTLSGNLYSNLVVNNDQLYVHTTSGTKILVALNSDGNEIWNYSTSSK